MSLGRTGAWLLLALVGGVVPGCLGPGLEPPDSKSRSGGKAEIPEPGNFGNGDDVSATSDAGTTGQEHMPPTSARDEDSGVDDDAGVDEPRDATSR